MEYFCKKRNEKLPLDNMPEDYCVNCKHYDTLKDCFACDLEIKFVDDNESNIIQLPIKFKTIQTSFGAYTVDRKDNLLRAFFYDGQELDLTKLNVIIHDNGIEFI